MTIKLNYIVKNTKIIYILSGYGNLVPMTQLGRIACICFALFGIPLLLVTIADIGKFLSDFLNFLYKSYLTFKTKVFTKKRLIIKIYPRFANIPVVFHATGQHPLPQLGMQGVKVKTFPIIYISKVPPQKPAA